MRFRRYSSPAWRRRVAERKIHWQIQAGLARYFERWSPPLKVELPCVPLDLDAFVTALTEARARENARTPVFMYVDDRVQWDDETAAILARYGLLSPTHPLRTKPVP